MFAATKGLWYLPQPCFGCPARRKSSGYRGRLVSLESKEQQCGFAVASEKCQKCRIYRCEGKESHRVLREGVRMDRGWRWEGGTVQLMHPLTTGGTGLAAWLGWKHGSGQCRMVGLGVLFVDGRLGGASRQPLSAALHIIHARCCSVTESCLLAPKTPREPANFASDCVRACAATPHTSATFTTRTQHVCIINDGPFVHCDCSGTQVGEEDGQQPIT